MQQAVLKTLSKLQPPTLAQHVDAITLLLEDEDPWERGAAVAQRHHVMLSLGVSGVVPGDGHLCEVVSLRTLGWVARRDASMHDSVRTALWSHGQRTTYQSSQHITHRTSAVQSRHPTRD